MSSSHRGPGLRGRRTEQAALDRLLAEVRDGQSRVLMLRGEAGIGKTVLLDYVQERAPECRVVRAAGVESEMELPFAVLHQLCAPMLNSLPRLPGPQSDALSMAFGLGAGAAPTLAAAQAKFEAAAPDTADELLSMAELGPLDDMQRAQAAKAQPAATEIVKIPNRGHALTIDHGWREVAQTALDFVERSASPGYASGRSIGTAPARRER